MMNHVLWNLSRYLADDTLIDTDGRDKLVGKLKGYQDKLYRDPLTEIYNRRYFEDEISRYAESCWGCNDRSG